MARPRAKDMLGSVGGATSTRPRASQMFDQPLVATKEKEETQPGFVQSMAQAIVKPFATMGANIASAVSGTFNLGQALVAKQQGNEEEFGRQMKQATTKIEVDLGGYLGKYGPIGAGEKLSTQIKQGVGTGAEIGSWFIGGGGGKNLIKELSKAGLSKGSKKVIEKTIIKEGAKKGAKIGAGAGGLGAGGAELAEKESTLGSVIKSTAVGVTAGAGLGAGIGALGGKVSTSLAGKKAAKLAKEVTIGETPKLAEVTSKIAPEAKFGAKQTIVAEKGISTQPVKPLETGVITKPSGVAKSIEAKAIENNLIKSFGEVAGFNPKTVKQQAQLMSDLMKSDIELAKKIVLGQEPLPPQINKGYFIKAMDDYAMETVDGALARDLINSPLMSETSEAGQTLRFLAERDPDSATAKILEVARARKEMATKRLRNVSENKVKSDIKLGIKEKITKSKTDKYNWQNIIDEIIC